MGSSHYSNLIVGIFEKKIYVSNLQKIKNC